MAGPAAAWHPDPTRRHEVRYWDGSRWTEHVASRGVQATDPLTAPPRVSSVMVRDSVSSSGLGMIDLVLCALAVLAVVMPGVSYVHALADDGIHLDGGPEHIRLTPHARYGIYVDDVDNSGYTFGCTARDAEGRQVRMRNPSWSISSSDTENLDFVFDSGAGDLTLDCEVPGERVTVRRVPNDPAMFAGFGLAALLGFPGIGLLIAWIIIRSSRAARA